MRLRLMMVMMSTLGLVACGATDSASLPIEGPDHSLTLVRTQPYLGSSEWDVALVVTRMPDCMRRYHLPSTTVERLKVEVYRSPAGLWSIKQGKLWYVAETGQCQLRKYDRSPADPGDYVGVFEAASGQLRFVPPATARKIGRTL